MNSAEGWMPRRWRAPRDHGGVLLEPEPTKLLSSLLEPLPLPSELAALRHEARPALYQAAASYTLAYRDVSTTHRAGGALPRILLAGHQPGLFHPGVWYKNFVLSAAASAANWLPINLIVDNDTLRAPAIKVPTGSASAPSIETIFFDAPRDEIPFEQSRIVDSDQFATFPGRVRAAMKAWDWPTCLESLWTYAQASARQTSNLGRILAAARHRLEADWGLNTLEVPLSEVFSHAPFRRFALRLLRDAPTFREVHNRRLAEFRRVNHVRSRSHPVPDLALRDDWHEIPMWVWNDDQPRRRHLFVRYAPRSLELSDLADWSAKLPRETAEEGLALEAWQAWERRGVKLRPRALLTTMYARLILSDCFLHGIGGAKYDELTDAIMRDYWRVSPPPFITATATLRLPITCPFDNSMNVASAQRRVRDLIYHAERWLPNHAATARKQQLIHDFPPHGARRTWQQEMAATQQQLAHAVAEERTELERRLPEIKHHERLCDQLRSREFAFCLYPAAEMQDLLTRGAQSPG